MLPKEILDGWKEREKAVVLTTVSLDGMPNSIWATCADMYNGEAVVVADNYFAKTKQNIAAGTPAS
ncbi:MAG: pyridoxamine 5'-phosphate oxidase family protein, partial [Spirochaetota bacterium]|nr:pyridoxamine 5'-phosphate oxidase family protein [Spirochaetota bacterium]